MGELTVEIPDGLPDEQKRDLQAWLTALAHEVIAELNAHDTSSMKGVIKRVSRRHGLAH